MDFLPDSRARVRRGAVRVAKVGTMIPIYCANCGKPQGLVPEEFMTFAFALCEPCAETHGDVAHTYKEPDQVFWARVHEAQMTKHKRLLNPFELAREIETQGSVLQKLAGEWMTHARKDL